MHINIFALGAMGIWPGHPLFYDVNVRALPEPLRSETMAALDADTLDCYTNYGRELWVPYAQLAAAIGFGHKLYDPDSPYFAPPEAILKVPFTKEPVTGASPENQKGYLGKAQEAAKYLAALSAAMPPRPFDIHIHATAPSSAPLRRLVEENAVRSHQSDEGWWISTQEVVALLPAGERFEDPASPWYVDPHDWADQDAVDRLIAEHRQSWPEIYERMD